MNYDSFILVSFGGPEHEDHIMPFLENVVRGRRVPRERLESVAVHYRHFGKSPINDQNRALLDAIRSEFSQRQITLPMYFGNRNWDPFLKDTVCEMQAAGSKKAIAFFTSMFSCYSGCRQYRENILEAQAKAGENPPIIEKVRMGYNHPKFIEATAARVGEKLEEFADEVRDSVRIVFTAHSIPMCMAERSTYQAQLLESCRLTSDELKHSKWELAFQSRSGSPHMPWLDPDIGEVLEKRIAEGEKDFIVMPIGFTSDHIEVLWDLDEEAREICDKHGVKMLRASTVGTHPAFVSMIVDLVEDGYFQGKIGQR